MICRKIRFRPRAQAALATGLLEAHEVAFVLFGITLGVSVECISQCVSLADVASDMRGVT
jgi:hypothetical protein